VSVHDVPLAAGTLHGYFSPGSTVTTGFSSGEK